jgi:hypothetical protein
MKSRVVVATELSGIWRMGRKLRTAGVAGLFSSAVVRFVKDTHSLRRGGATAAHRAGVTDGVVQRTDGWKSLAYQVYIDDDGEERCGWTGKV